QVHIIHKKNNDVYSFIAENNWEPLSQIPFAQLPLIENYSSIVKNYAKDHQDSFNKRYPTTKITAKLDADVLMDFSCFFLEKNPMLKNTLLGYGLTNIDIIEVTTNEMSKKMEGNDQKIGELAYTLITISGSLRISERLDSD
ncbi:TPA: hypothetical protein ACYSQH_001775, partial [Yersinia enterocolitica]